MHNLTEECAAMAARMLDAELMAVLRKSESLTSKTPLQQAIEAEARRRSLGD